MEKTITLRNTEITFSIWDLGGQREFLSMLPLVCNDAVATFFMFDLSRKSTLNSVKVSLASYNCIVYMMVYIQQIFFKIAYRI
jgi:GTPase SAR1 family protein